ncbi:formyltetrahydrofolate-dependent phosphoribosylglycinamide formyltransferase [Alteribacillus persepolensis]|uniref:Phosphoribosylglycinamide formyltransferase n=1 Tax=Alteribacillus persepolensis TaxID=568899 RepID=A0A1G8F618_9BACI|nr:phosphoribosylglycinamide formyltransferase [Alteribacillus persepolensis]SDH77570.1 formyltetrahydrofolate-dependent phosphoribosylglycinamide formyltransferase [Alteribacillus persepolensis]
MKLAVFASGSGSNFQAIADAIEEDRLQAEISLLVSDKPEAYAVERAKTLGISVFTFRPKEYQNKRAFENEIVKHLHEKEIDIIILAGYMRLIGPILLQTYEGCIFNIHPSLLPAFPGKNAIEQAWHANVKVTGVTVHMVDEGMDTGPIIAQESVDIKDTDSLASLTKAIQAVEHRLYPDTIQRLIEKRTSEGSQNRHEHQTSIN